jgi:CRISPR-associated protein Cas1
LPALVEFKSTLEVIEIKAKTLKLILDDSGSFLGRGKGCLIVSDKKRNVEKYPLFENEVGEVQIKIGNSVSSGALATCAFWGIDLVILTQRGKPVAVLKSLDNDSHIKTRIYQYESLKNGVGIEIAKKIVLGRIYGQNQILTKYRLKQRNMQRIKEAVNKIRSDKLYIVRKQLMHVEGKHADHYFHQIFHLLPKSIMVTKRRTFKAYDGINNTFNLAYTVLKWKVHRAILRAKLEPFLGFLHSEQFGKPSLVCDLMELYRYLIDDFIIKYNKTLAKKDFTMKHEDFSSKKKGKREYLSKPLAKDLMKKLDSFFKLKVEVPRVKHGSKQEIESLINEEAMLLAKYLRNEKSEWIPRIPKI